MSSPRLPDLLTTANLACGLAAILFAAQGELTAACWLVFAGAGFDVLDGLAARALGGGSELGRQLDSLADMVTFGVAPGCISAIVPGAPLAPAPSPDGGPGLPAAPCSMLGEPLWASLLGALVIAIASMWRLARFNIDTRQANGFLGLATPANALLWASLAIIAQGVGMRPGPRAVELQGLIDAFMASPVQKLLLAIALGGLMLSSIPLPSLKFKHSRWQGNQVIYLLIGAGGLLVLLYGILAVPLIVLAYLLSPLWGRMFRAGA
ncbi:MAG: CDP-alcohol phosphatidyltransferase family protein [Flavobacteriales bacterium]